MEGITDGFGEIQQIALNLVLAAMVFGVALDIDPSSFRKLIKNPKGPVAGISAQFLLLPAVTWCFTMIIDVDPSIELGMLLVACCPGGAISNFIAMLARANVALSISMTAASSLLAIILLPFNFGFWASLNPETAALLAVIDVGSKDIFYTVLIVLAVPLALGQGVRAYSVAAASVLHKGLKHASVVALFGFIIIAVASNTELFLTEFWLILGIVLAHNSLAFFVGYMSARLSKLTVSDGRAVIVEVGIQNSSLAIAIIFTNFGASPGMAMIAAFWGVWHIVAGMAYALIVRRYPAVTAS